MNEKAYKTKIVKFLKSNGCDWVYCPNDTIQRGVPDIIASIDGSIIAIELKYSENMKKGIVKLGHPLDANQSSILRKINRNAYVLVGCGGGKSMLISSAELNVGVTRSFDGELCDTEEIIKQVLTDAIQVQKL